MKKGIVVISFIMMAGAAFAQSKSDQIVLELSKKKFQWMIAMKFDSLESVLDDRLEFVHSNGWSENKQQFIGDIKSGKLRYNSIEVLEASVRVYPSTAVVIGRGKFTVTLDGKDLSLELKYTEVYIQKNTKWVLASRHANRMQ